MIWHYWWRFADGHEQSRCNSSERAEPNPMKPTAKKKCRKSDCFNLWWIVWQYYLPTCTVPIRADHTAIIRVYFNPITNHSDAVSLTGRQVNGLLLNSAALSTGERCCPSCKLKHAYKADLRVVTCLGVDVDLAQLISVQLGSIEYYGNVWFHPVKI